MGLSRNGGSSFFLLLFFRDYSSIRGGGAAPVLQNRAVLNEGSPSSPVGTAAGSESQGAHVLPVSGGCECARVPTSCLFQGDVSVPGCPRPACFRVM
ncbi:hypothetical protein ANANG_G00298640 [Anguilla anguilla]|uniref:Uncharacterized protein n=1 Tax=Anguilla anguilla TaxID=7936 RepID=A0A9D3LIV2_ANGAN|nr:hypothetical protein ANANG_G00298640 [Anguilla anguilla]